MFKLRNTTGNTVPPIDEANEAIPMAVDRLLLNQWAITLYTGPNMTPHETYKQSEQLDRQSLDARGRSTDTNAETLTEQKMPVLVALCNQECT
jgi:hypothetical protein